MTVYQGAILDTAATGYAACLAALLSATNANIDYTLSALPMQAVADNVNLRVVVFIAEEADFTGDAASLALTAGNHVTSDLCRGRLMTASQLETFGFHLMGDAGKCVSAKAGDGIQFFSQDGGGAFDGSTPHDAFKQFDESDLGFTIWPQNMRNVPIGCVFAQWSIGGSSPSSRMPEFQNAEGNEHDFRMDYMANPGIVLPGYCFTLASWSVPDAGSFPRVWRSTNFTNAFAAQWLLPFNARLSTTDLYDQHVFKIVASQTECENTPMSMFKPGGSELWIHMPDDSNPTSRISNSLGGGWNLIDKATRADTETPYDGVSWINLQYFGASPSLGGAMCGVTRSMPKSNILGGRFLMGCSFKPKQQPNTHPVRFGRSIDGDICWDTSDRPDPANDNYIQNIINNHGSDAATWALIDRFVEIDSSEEGIYFFGGGFTEVAEGSIVSGALIPNIGSRHPTLVTKYGADGYSDIDAHAVGGQGCSGSVFEFLYIKNAGACIVMYANGDGTSTQNQQNITIQDFVIVDNHNRATGAGGWGIDLTGNGNWAGERTNGTGLMGGNVIRRGHLENIQSGYGGSPPIDGAAISLYTYQGMTVDSVTIKFCDLCFSGGNTKSTDSSFAEDPAYISPQYTVSNCVLQEPTFYFFWHRFTNWTASSPRPNLGYYRFNNNTYIFPSGGDVDADALWRFVSSELARAAWQASTKASPPGDLPSIYDPDSTFELAA